ncbi:MAG: tRNA pseudouridine(38-40) synthase TruA [Roseburia sp.]|nr:tRNA pseudouridine(38-40) synthase TruA [Roseburia sp.]
MENREGKRVCLTVAYDGTNYHGWQIQNNAVTIEGELNRCLCGLLGEEIAVIGASRTDAGVHALCNMAVFDTTSPMPADKISYALNQRLPEDIRIQKSQQVASDWHPRHCESRKTYEYRIYRGSFPMPVRRLYTLFTYAALDVERMRQAAGYLVGEHDFKSFCQTGAQVESTVRTLYRVQLEEEGAELVIRVTGNGFLYNMVRIIVGTLIEVGCGRRAPQDMPKILEARDRAAAGPTAPAHGLMLVKYEVLSDGMETDVDFDRVKEEK